MAADAALNGVGKSAAFGQFFEPEIAFWRNRNSRFES